MSLNGTSSMRTWRVPKFEAFTTLILSGTVVEWREGGREGGGREGGSEKGRGREGDRVERESREGERGGRGGR